MKNRKPIIVLSIFLASVFIVAQFVFKTTSTGGGWCSPYLGAPAELGHAAYQFVNYGFPIPFLTLANENCFEARSTTYEWSPIGIIVDILLLAMIAFPIWTHLLSRMSKKNSPQ